MSDDEKISELIGVVADLSVSLHNGDIQQQNLISVFNIAGVENPYGDNYKRTDGLIRKAHTYHTWVTQECLAPFLRD